MSEFMENEHLWGLQYSPKYTSILIFLPYGIMKVLSCSKDTTLEMIKNDTWSKVKTDALFVKLKDKSSYIFSGVTEYGTRDEFYDETKRLCDLRLFYACLKLLQPEGDKEEKVLNSHISFVLGKPLDDFEKSNDSETKQFRKDSVYFIHDIVRKREEASIDDRLKYFFPPELDDFYYLIKIRSEKERKKLNLIKESDFQTIDFNKSPHKFESNIELIHKDDPVNSSHDIVNRLTVCVWFVDDKTNRFREEFEIDSETRPSELIELCRKLFNTDKLMRYLLKVCGADQYLLNEQSVLRYKYIVECISKEQTPQLCLARYDDVATSLPKTNFIMPTFLKKLNNLQKNDPKQYDQNPSLWTQCDKKFSITIHSITYINITDIEKIYIKAGLFHGNEPLCEPMDTKQVDAKIPKWNEKLKFDINMEDIPRSAKICLAVCAVRKKTLTHFASKWANLKLFDYYGRLSSGRLELNLFPLPENYNDFLFPLGNVNAKSLENSSTLNIEFYQNKIIFPKVTDIFQHAVWAMKIEKEGKSYGYRNENKNRHLPNTKMNEEEEKRFNELLRKDQLSIVSEEDKDFLFKWRLECCKKNPESLPKLIDSVRWNNREETSQLYFLLENWEAVRVETALELLDRKYSDYFVRRYAIKWLDQSISDGQLYEYLLQLVQVLKYEPYFDNELTRFLIRRSLLNRKIGHHFFWHIKSEMNDPSHGIRFSLILEAYCRGIGEDLLNETIRQVDAIDKLTKLTENFKTSSQKKKSRFLADFLQQPEYREALKNFRNPLNCSIQLGELEIKSCQIMDSSKEPLWLVWNNLDPLADCSLLKRSTVIFKSGDDLRQDMLTLQVIKIINFIWRSEGFDLKMIPYTCLATGKQVGMIEVISNANTVMDIQKQRGMMAALQIDSKQLNKWIKEKNRDNYDKAVDNFTRSCAGYCVATLILGIGDRHPANIMVREDGQIFHIDFGHFLGHFKRKLGVNRERVPFVLASDFLRVISKGAQYSRKSVEFEQFSELCCKAYLSLRKHANLLITLFTMMLYTGIPELQSIEDIEYLRDKLQVDKSDNEAIDYINGKLREAACGNWSTKVDWFFHHVAHFDFI